MTYKIIDKSFNDCVIFFQTRKTKNDNGFLQESWNNKQFKLEIANYDFTSDKLFVFDKNIFEGMYFQNPNDFHARILNCLYGKVFIFVMDIRPESIHFGKVQAYELNDSSMFLFIPEGFAYGIYTLNDYNIINCKSSNSTVENEYVISLLKSLYPNDIMRGVTSTNKEFSINCNMIRNVVTNENNLLSLKEFYK